MLISNQSVLGSSFRWTIQAFKGRDHSKPDFNLDTVVSDKPEWPNLGPSTFVKTLGLRRRCPSPARWFVRSPLWHAASRSGRQSLNKALPSKKPWSSDCSLLKPEHAFLISNPCFSSEVLQDSRMFPHTSAHQAQAQAELPLLCRTFPK